MSVINIDSKEIYSHNYIIDSAQQVGFFNIRLGIEQNTTYRVGFGSVGVLKYTIRYFQVSFLLLGFPGTSGIFGYFRVCQVFTGISGYIQVYWIPYLFWW